MSIILKIGELLNYIIPVLVTLGLVYFIWGIIMYVISDSEEAKEKGRNHIIFGLIGLAVIIGLWGLVFVIVDTFNLDNSNNVAPSFNNLLPQPNP